MGAAGPVGAGAVAAQDVEWKNDDAPSSTAARHTFTIDRATTQDYRYELRGNAGRWFITREPAQPDQGSRTVRTKFYPNQRTAQEIFTELTTG